MQEERQHAKIDSKMTQGLKLADKGFKEAVLAMVSEVKAGMFVVHEKTHNLDKEGNKSNNQMEMIQL